MEQSVQTKKSPVRDLSKLSFGEPLPSEVRDFCTVHGLIPAINQAIALARQFFAVDPTALYLSRDPDTSEEWVTVFVTTATPPEAASDIYELYVKEWVRVADLSAQAKIRLSYTVE